VLVTVAFSVKNQSEPPADDGYWGVECRGDTASALWRLPLPRPAAASPLSPHPASGELPGVAGRARAPAGASRGLPVPLGYRRARGGGSGAAAAGGFGRPLLAAGCTAGSTAPLLANAEGSAIPLRVVFVASWAQCLLSGWVFGGVFW